MLFSKQDDATLMIRSPKNISTCIFLTYERVKKISIYTAGVCVGGELFTENILYKLCIRDNYSEQLWRRKGLIQKPTNLENFLLLIHKVPFQAEEEETAMGKHGLAWKIHRTDTEVGAQRKQAGLVLSCVATLLSTRSWD